MADNRRLFGFTKMYLGDDRVTTKKIISELRRYTGEKSALREFMGEVIAPFMDDVELDSVEFQDSIKTFVEEGRTDTFMTFVIPEEQLTHVFGKYTPTLETPIYSFDSNTYILSHALKAPQLLGEFASARFVYCKDSPERRRVLLIYTEETAEDVASSIWRHLLAMHRHGLADAVCRGYTTLEEIEVLRIADMVIHVFSAEDQPATTPPLEEGPSGATLENRKVLQDIRTALLNAKSAETKRPAPPKEDPRIPPMSSAAVIAAQRPVVGGPTGRVRVLREPAELSMEAAPLSPFVQASFAACGVPSTWMFLRDRREAHRAANQQKEEADVPLLKTTPLVPLVQHFVLRTEEGHPLGGLDDNPESFPRPPSPLPDMQGVQAMRHHQAGMPHDRYPGTQYPSAPPSWHHAHHRGAPHPHHQQMMAWMVHQRNMNPQFAAVAAAAARQHAQQHAQQQQQQPGEWDPAQRSLPSPFPKEAYEGHYQQQMAHFQQMQQAIFQQQQQQARQQQ